MPNKRVRNGRPACFVIAYPASNVPLKSEPMGIKTRREIRGKADSRLV
jgi:hypothetical protein